MNRLFVWLFETKPASTAVPKGSPAACMHFVTTEYDKGPVFFRYNLRIREDDTPESLGERVNQAEHQWQPIITNMIVTRQITWSGKTNESPLYPQGYEPITFDD